jgi:predicted DNA binding CopG/RHH family protein
MLETVQQSNATATSPVSDSFASLIAALAGPARRPEACGDGSLQAGWQPAVSSNDDGLEDDIATLSYERALRAHVRYRNPDPAMAQSAETRAKRYEEPCAADPAAVQKPAARSIAGPRHAANSESASEPESETTHLRSTPYERNLKLASITIRMSKMECAQLHRRAADAGLTVSAYLRSCTFEAESLRAMVKDAMAQLRSAKAQAKPADLEPTRRSLLGRVGRRLVRFVIPGHGGRRVSRA